MEAARNTVAPSALHAHPSILTAALWMAGWLSAMVVLAVAGREATRELAVFQIMEMRSVIGLILLYPLVRRSGGFTAMKTQRLAQHIGRNTVHYAAQFGWFVALTMIPLAQLVAIEFTMPIWTAVLCSPWPCSANAWAGGKARRCCSVWSEWPSSCGRTPAPSRRAS